MQGIVASIRTFVLDSVFPEICLACGTEGEVLCQVCSEEVAPTIVWCAFEQNIGDGVEGEQFGAMARASHPIIRRAIHALKFGYREGIADAFGTRLGELVSESGAMLPDDAIVVPVPLSKARMVERDFNQAARIAMAMVRASGRATWLCDESILIRTRKTRAQATIEGREARFANVAGAFACTRAIEGSIILVDDVITTGATTMECVRALRAAGAMSVYVLAIAHG